MIFFKLKFLFRGLSKIIQDFSPCPIVFSLEDKQVIFKGAAGVTDQLISFFLLDIHRQEVIV